ncbi:MAG TPA: sialidase family protein [Hanamia sp.]|nr:sialidase family protein [Hanamia sp.]
MATKVGFTFGFFDVNKMLVSLLVISIVYGFTRKSQSYRDVNEDKGKQTVLKLETGPNNPRNSEGDFITLKNSKILFIYSHFTGKSGGDFGHAYLASRFSADSGKTWSKEDKVVVKQKGNMNVMSVSLLRLRNGSVALFYARKNSDDNCIPMLRISTDESKTWSDPIPCITDRKGYFVLNNNRVIQLSSGRLVMPVALHNVPNGKWSNIGRLFTYYSDDNGKTWKSGKEVPNPENVTTQEPGIIQLRNDSLFMFIRTDTGVQYASYSVDKGETWSPVQPIHIASPLSPASIARIPDSGDLLMVWNNNGTNQKRTPLNVAVSKNEGKSWEHIKIIEDDPDGVYCYTAIHFTGKYVLLAFANWKTMGTTIIRLNLQWIYK